MTPPTVKTRVREEEDYNFEENEESVEANEESPSTLPSNKHKYVMAVNNSKLARRPYYK